MSFPRRWGVDLRDEVGRSSIRAILASTASVGITLLHRSQLWVALMGPTVEEGIVGIGPTVEAALRAFDAQYLAGLRPPTQSLRRGIYNSSFPVA